MQLKPRPKVPVTKLIDTKSIKCSGTVPEYRTLVSYGNTRNSYRDSVVEPLHFDRLQLIKIAAPAPAPAL